MSKQKSKTQHKSYRKSHFSPKHKIFPNNFLAYRFHAKSELTVPFLVTLCNDSFKITSFDDFGENWIPDLYQIPSGEKFYLKATSGDTSLYSRASYFINFENEEGVAQKALVILASPLKNNVTGTPSIKLFELNDFSDEMTLPICFRKKIIAQGLASSFRNPKPRKKARSQKFVKKMPAQEYAENQFAKLRESGRIKTDQEQYPRFEWSHLLGYSLTNGLHEPQSKENIACAPAWVNTLMMIPEGVTRYFSKIEDESVFIDSKISFFLIESTDLVFAVKYDLKLRKNHNVARIVLNIRANEQAPFSIESQDTSFLVSFVERILDNDLLKLKSRSIEKSTITTEPALSLEDNVPEKKRVSFIYDLNYDLVEINEPNIMSSPIPLKKKMDAKSPAPNFLNTPVVKIATNPFLSKTAANVGEGSLNISSASRLQQHTLSKKNESSSLQSCLHQIEYQGLVDMSRQTIQGVVVWVNNEKYMLSSADVFLKSFKKEIFIDNQAVKFKKISIERVDPHLNLALFHFPELKDMAAHLFSESLSCQDLELKESCYAYILNDHFRATLITNEDEQNGCMDRSSSSNLFDDFDITITSISGSAAENKTILEKKAQIYKEDFFVNSKKLVYTSPRHFPFRLPSISASKSSSSFNYQSFFIFKGSNCLGFSFQLSGEETTYIMPNEQISFFLTQAKIKNPHTLAGLGCSYTHTPNGTKIKYSYYPGSFLKEEYQLQNGDLIKAIDNIPLKKGVLLNGIDLESYLTSRVQPSVVNLEVQRGTSKKYQKVMIKHTLSDAILPLVANYPRNLSERPIVLINQFSFTPITKDLLDREASSLSHQKKLLLKNKIQISAGHELIAVYHEKIFKGYITKVIQLSNDQLIDFLNLKDFLRNIKEANGDLLIETDTNRMPLCLSQKDKRELIKKINSLSAYNTSRISQGAYQAPESKLLKFAAQGLRLSEKFDEALKKAPSESTETKPEKKEENHRKRKRGAL